jgi:uncharacterized protein (TIGR00369 family)
MTDPKNSGAAASEKNFSEPAVMKDATKHVALTEAARGWLRDLASPWVNDLNLIIEQVDASAARLRLPFDQKLCREGGTICGQALVSASDTAMIMAIGGFLGGYRPMTTVNLNINFMRPVANGDVILSARVFKPGKTLTFGEIELTGPDGKLVAHATCTYAML